MRQLTALLSLAALGSAAQAGPALPPGAHYVAMGSSFAAGPGVTTSADTPPNRCTRSADNYAHQLARKLALNLSDVSCGGATTAHILGPWNELSAQIDALCPDTRLVTVTIGGNDVGYIAGLFRAACAGDPNTAVCKGMAARSSGQSPMPEPDDVAWAALEARFDRIAAEVRSRSPAARLVIVDYLTILPARGTCAVAPADGDGAARSRAKAARLAALTVRVARRAGAGLIRASQLSKRHDACSKQPWVTGFVVPGAPYHPNLAGMTAVATALEREIAKN